MSGKEREYIVTVRGRIEMSTSVQQEVERLLKMALEQNGQLDETVERMDEHRKGIEDENAALRERWARFNE